MKIVPENFIPKIIGIAGGSGAGKSSIIEYVVNKMKMDQATIIQQDWYYRDWRHVPLEKRSDINFDVPDAFDSLLLVEHIKGLRQNHPVEAPVYDYVNHIRISKTRTVEPSKVIFLEGILILVEKGIRDLLDLNIFIECDIGLRFARRLKRDVVERGRSEEVIKKQWESTVIPMHDKYVEPSKTKADFIIENNGDSCNYPEHQILKLIKSLFT